MKKVQEAQYLSYHGHSAVNFIILILCLLIRTNSQASPIYNVPSQGIQTNAVTLIIGGQLTNGKSNINITFEKQFYATPSIVLGLAGLNSLNGQIALFQQATSRTQTYFTHKLTLQDLRSSIQYLKITYLAINLIKFYYVYPHSLVIERII